MLATTYEGSGCSRLLFVCWQRASHCAVACVSYLPSAQGWVSLQEGSLLACPGCFCTIQLQVLNAHPCRASHTLSSWLVTLCMSVGTPLVGPGLLCACVTGVVTASAWRQAGNTWNGGCCFVCGTHSAVAVTLAAWQVHVPVCPECAAHGMCEEHGASAWLLGPLLRYGTSTALVDANSWGHSTALAAAKQRY